MFRLSLQLNLKFEIEVLCKNLSLDINDLKPGSLLKDKDKLKSLEEQLSAPKKEAKPPEEMLPIVPPGADRAPLPSPLRGGFLNVLWKCVYARPSWPMGRDQVYWILFSTLKTPKLKLL